MLGRTAPEGATPRQIYQVAINQLVCHLNALPSYEKYKREKGN
jgi:hypothetical protein